MGKKKVQKTRVRRSEEHGVQEGGPFPPAIYRTLLASCEARVRAVPRPPARQACRLSVMMNEFDSPRIGDL